MEVCEAASGWHTSLGVWINEEKITVIEMGSQVAQSVEHRTLDVEVRESKPALGTGGGVGSHLTSPIRRDARSLEDQDLGN